jgi:hypothetical protein
MTPNFANVIRKLALDQTSVDEAQIACALERYRLANGRYPDALAALSPRFISTVPQDIIGGGPLKYHTTGDGQYMLYSIGWDETDEGGTVVMGSDGKTQDIAQGDWVWSLGP